MADKTICYTLNNSSCRKAAREEIPKNIDNYVTGVSEYGQRTCSLKYDGYPSLATVCLTATHFPPKLLVVSDRLVFWLSVVLARPSQSCDQWSHGVVSITAAGAAGDSHPLPRHNGVKPVGLNDEQNEFCSSQQYFSLLIHCTFIAHFLSKKPQ